jgi:hypothetical protein
MYSNPIIRKTICRFGFALNCECSNKTFVVAATNDDTTAAPCGARSCYDNSTAYEDFTVAIKNCLAAMYSASKRASSASCRVNSARMNSKWSQFGFYMAPSLL